MKKLKGLLSLIFVLLLSTYVICSFVNVNAKTVTTDDGQYNYTTTNESVREIVAGVNYTINTGYTTRSSKNYDQKVNLFSADLSQNSNIKIATWSSLNGSGTGFTRQGLLAIAKDYEEHNPGWVVLAGINADQYYTKIGTGLGVDGSTLYVSQPYYPNVSNGDNLFVATPYGYSSNVVGFKNDGSSDPFVYGTRSNKGFYIHIYNSNNEEVGAYPIDGLNCELGTNKTVVLSGYREDASSIHTLEKTSTNSIYVVEKADLSYVSSTVAWKSWDPHAVDGFFGKGTISKIVNSVSLGMTNQFAIETANEDLKAKLSVGTYIKVQIEFDDGFNGIEEAIGFHTVQRLDGQDKNVANSYNSRAYPRSVFGCDANGKIYLMTCFGDNSSPTTGLYAQEFNALCKTYNITDAFQMDGGGSVTCVARDENGILQYADACIEKSHQAGTPTYSDYRSILSGLFIVMKAPEASVEVTSKTDTTTNILVNTSKLIGCYDKASLKVTELPDNITTSYALDLTKEANELNLTGLKANTEYNYEIFVQNNGYNEQKSFINGSFNTNKSIPIVQSLSVKNTAKGPEVTIHYEDASKCLVKLYASINGKKYIFNTSAGVGTLVLKDGLSALDIEIVADCVLDPTSTRHSEVELTMKNASYPIVSYFEYPIITIEDIIQKMFE